MRKHVRWKSSLQWVKLEINLEKLGIEIQIIEDLKVGIKNLDLS